MIPETASLWATARRFEGILRSDAGAYSFAPLSDIYRRLGLLEDALETARKGCALHPDFAAGQMALARAALDSAIKNEAVSALEKVVSITPENLEAQRLLAELYTAEGNGVAARRCLLIASSLDTEEQVIAAPIAGMEEELQEEEILEADILELSDEFIEDESFAENLVDPFSALPDRPSLGEDFSRAEPYLMESPPVYHDEPPVVEPSPLMLSATIAELYVNQGFTDKGVDVYRELLAADPLNESYMLRLKELTKSAEEPGIALQNSPPPEGVISKLYEWLGNIGRVRECRTKNL